jgi:hypothetical protein
MDRQCALNGLYIYSLPTVLCKVIPVSEVEFINTHTYSYNGCRGLLSWE